MNYHVEVRRFHRGEPQGGQAPEIIVAQAPPDTPPEAGDLLVVLVELSPPMSHRAREIRTLAAQVYWRSSGSIIARLRRALTEANRYLITRNEAAPPDEQGAGSITCALFHGDELFLGQVGAANAFFQSPHGSSELFPRHSRLYPLGASLPPVINIGYAQLEPGSTLLLATGEIAEAQARSLWAETLAPHRATEQSLETIGVTIGEARASGALVFIRCEAEESLPAPAEQKFRRRSPTVEGSPPTIRPGGFKPRRIRLPGVPHLLPKQRPTFPVAEIGRRLSIWGGQIVAFGRRMARWWSDRLLPRPVQEGHRRRLRPIPQEQPLLTGGVAAGFLLIVAFITLTTYLQEGGAHRATQLLQEAREKSERAYSLQTEEAWSSVIETCDHILALDPENVEARELRQQAQEALDALSQAAILQIHPLLELKSSRQVRHLLVIDHWLYILDPDEDTLVAYRLSEDGTTLAGEAPVTILSEEKTILGESVGELVDMTWLEPTTGYKGGAIFVYGEGGILYTYEPDLGPESCTLTHLRGDPLPPASVTAVDAYGNAFYLLQRQRNQILKYQPHNGLYDNPPRPYFAQHAAPPMAEALDMAIDGRIYLLMGNGELQAYIEGVPDPSFALETFEDLDFHPTIMAMERDPDEGRFYLADPSSERIGVFDKRGHLLHRYRLEGEALRHLEAIAVQDEPYVLYLLMDQVVYAAPFPALVNPGAP